MIKEEKYILSNNVSIPKIGFGTWLLKKKDAKEVVSNAINVGYTHIDTAQAYLNEKEVYDGVLASNIKREDIFITSKVAAEIKSYKRAKNSIDKTIAKLGGTYVDLMLIHCPQPWALYRTNISFDKQNKEVWKALEEAYLEGKIKSIGVSNFSIHDLENIMENCKVKPMVNQIPVHIGNTDMELIEFCQKNDILVEAYCPNGHGRILKNEDIKKIADKYNVSVPRLCIRYTLELGTLPLPKTLNVDHMKENTDVDFTISKEDMEILKSFKGL